MFRQTEIPRSSKEQEKKQPRRGEKQDEKNGGGHNTDRLDGPTRGGNSSVVLKYRAQQRMKHTRVDKDSH